jgi:pre-mRNA-splicing factor CWC22
VNKLRNGAKFFGHLLYTETIEWACLRVIKLTEDDTTSASRIFIKILLQEIAENLGVQIFAKKIEDVLIKPHMVGLFPKDTIANARFAVNFFTSIGLGALTEDLRTFLENAPNLLLQQKYAELLAQAQAMEDDSGSSSDSSSSSSSSSNSKPSKEESKDLD